MTRCFSFLAAALCAAPAFAQTVPAMPNPVLTPGAVDASVTLSAICNRATKERRHVSQATQAAVARAYGVDPRDIGVHYEMDHLVPLAIGGANLPANLWPQPYPDATTKDALERELQHRACVAYRTLTPVDAAKVLADEQREVAADWVAAYRRYVGEIRRR